MKLIKKVLMTRNCELDTKIYIITLMMATYKIVEKIDSDLNEKTR